MTKDEIKDCLLDFSQNGIFQPTNHCRTRMRQRGVQHEDILNVFAYGIVVSHSFDQVDKNWECVVEGNDLDGDSLTVVAAVYEDCYTVKCITVK